MLLKPMKTKTGVIEVVIPKLDPDGEANRVQVEVPLRWDDELQDWVLTPEAHERIEAAKARYTGLMSPSEIKAMRQRLGLTQSELSELLQIGKKTLTRWESGRERPSRSLNVLLCGLRDGRLDVPYLRLLAASRRRLECVAAEQRSPWSKVAMEVLSNLELRQGLDSREVDESLRNYLSGFHVSSVPRRHTKSVPKKSESNKARVLLSWQNSTLFTRSPQTGAMTEPGHWTDQQDATESAREPISAA